MILADYGLMLIGTTIILNATNKLKEKQHYNCNCCNIGHIVSPSYFYNEYRKYNITTVAMDYTSFIVRIASTISPWTKVKETVSVTLYQ